MRCIRQRWAAGLLLATWLLAAPSTFAADVDRAPTLAQAVEGAWHIAVDARRAESEPGRAEAGLRAARSFLADAPSFTWSRQDGDWYGGEGAGTAVETEAALSWPLWMPGQRRAAIGAARADAAWAAANLEQARQDVAAQVRVAAWELVAQQAEVDAAQSAVDAMTELARIVERRVDSGDLAKSDLLACRADVLEAEINRDDALRRLAAQKSRWRLLTGYDQPVDMDELAATIVADPDKLVDGGASPPAVVAAEEAVRRAEATLEAARRSLGAPPELTLGAKEESESPAFAGDRSLVLSLRIPLGTGARRDVALAKARTELDVARAELAMARASHATGVATAMSDLAAARGQFRDARERSQVLESRREMLQRAFVAGEIPLSEILVAHRAARLAASDLVRRKAEQGLAHTRLLHAIGTIQ